MVGANSIKLLWKLSPRDILPALFVASLAATFAALRGIWNLFYLYSDYHKGIAAGAEVNIDPTLQWMQVRIGLALIISAIGLYFRNVQSLIISMVGLIWVGIEYLNWRNSSLRIKELAGIESFNSTVPYAENLYGATRVDVAILVIVVALFVWEIKILTGIWIPARSNRRFIC